MEIVEVIQLTFDVYKKNTKPAHDDKIVEVLNPGRRSISALILPPGQMCPSFMDVTKEGR
jgi:hypothetical protein